MKTEDTFDPFADLKKIAPECFFEPKYPYVFKFDLILDGKNYGQLEITVNDFLIISNMKGAETALKKIDEIALKEKGNEWTPYPESGECLLNYPLKTIDEIEFVLGARSDCNRNGLFKINGDFQAMREFIGKVANPVDTASLYKKTGEIIIYG